MRTTPHSNHQFICVESTISLLFEKYFSTILGRPTEYAENDVFVCDNKYFPDEKIITKLKKGLRVSRQLSNFSELIIKGGCC